MKNNFKKLTAIAISSLGILASAPSAFCAPKMKLPKLSSLEKCDETTSPTQSDSELAFSGSTPSAFRALKITPELKDYKVIDGSTNPYCKSAFTTKVLTGEKITEQSVGGIINEKFLEAPFAKVVVDSSLSHQPNLEKIKFGKVDYLGSNAFKNCDKLKEIVFNDKLTLIEPGAFAGCRKDLKIIYKGKKYSVPELLSKIRPVVRVKICSKPLKPLLFTHKKK